jgi:5-methylcytosine-specific restriction endonuclease McrA
MKAEIIEVRNGLFIRSVKNVFPYPSVIRLFNFSKRPASFLELSRKNILRRDNYQCQYCGKSKGDLTIDHVIPRSRGGGDTWENLVTACHTCNSKKGNRTPDEAGMKLITKPKKPHHIFMLKQFAGASDENWKQFLFM